MDEERRLEDLLTQLGITYEQWVKDREESELHFRQSLDLREMRDVLISLFNDAVLFDYDPATGYTYLFRKGWSRYTYPPRREVLALVQMGYLEERPIRFGNERKYAYFALTEKGRNFVRLCAGAGPRFWIVRHRSDGGPVFIHCGEAPPKLERLTGDSRASESEYELVPIPEDSERDVHQSLLGVEVPERSGAGRT